MDMFTLKNVQVCEKEPSIFKALEKKIRKGVMGLHEKNSDNTLILSVFFILKCAE